MNDNSKPIEGDFENGKEVSTSVDLTNVGLVTRTEIDQQITTANKFPRSVTSFQREARELVTLNEATASSCIYALPRKELDRESGRYIVKNIEGPSARFAEIMMYSWRNARAGARLVDESENFIVAQGVFQDVERNFAITFEVPRRISGSTGKRYSVDMIAVTGNAAASIALRNAILKGIPKALWEPAYNAARHLIAGDIKSLANKRQAALDAFAVFGIYPDAICRRLGKVGVADITGDDLVLLAGYLTSIRDDGVAPEVVFPDDEEIAGPKAKAPNGDSNGTQAPPVDKPVKPKAKAKAAAPAPSAPLQAAPVPPAAAEPVVAAPPASPAPADPQPAAAPAVPHEAAAPEAPRQTLVAPKQAALKAPTGTAKMVLAKANGMGIPEKELCEYLELAALSDMTVQDAMRALAWINSL